MAQFSLCILMSLNYKTGWLLLRFGCRLAQIILHCKLQAQLARVWAVPGPWYFCLLFIHLLWLVFASLLSFCVCELIQPASLLRHCFDLSRRGLQVSGTGARAGTSVARFVPCLSMAHNAHRTDIPQAARTVCLHPLHRSIARWLERVSLKL